jgi:hypothetical protein
MSYLRLESCLVAGTLLLVNSQRYEQDALNTLALSMNYPTIVALMILYGENILIPLPIPITDAITVLISITIWTLIGYMVYCFYKIFTSKAVD